MQVPRLALTSASLHPFPRAASRSRPSRSLRSLDSHDWPPFAGPLHLAHPPSLQFTVPRGVPLYPVEMMRLLRTRTAPTRRFMQFDLWEASEARVWCQLDIGQHLAMLSPLCAG